MVPRHREDRFVALIGIAAFRLEADQLISRIR